MKKFSIYFATIVAVLGLASCAQDKDPVYQAPTTFVLNEPVFQNDYYQLQEGNSFYVFCSQPDYGYSAITNYALQVSLTQDFATYEEIASAGTGTSAAMQIKDDKMALAICQLYGVETEEDMAQFNAETGVKVYIRAHAWLTGVESSNIVSNVVSLNKVMPYFAVPQPDFIYLVGKPEGWVGPTESNAAHYADWKLLENQDEIGSKVYHGTFYIGNGADGEAMFRFYTALTGWDDDSYGSQEEDNPIDQFFTDNLWQYNLVKGKGSFNFPDWPGGVMVITVDMSTDNPFVVIEGRPGETLE